MTEDERREQQGVLERLRGDARMIAAHFGLPLRSIDAERPRVKRRYGVCFEDGSIRIRLRHARTGRLLRYSALVDTLCHELAHLRHFDHGPRFHVLYRRILDWARAHGIYRPERRVRRPARPVRPPLPPLLAALGAGTPSAVSRTRPDASAVGSRRSANPPAARRNGPPRRSVQLELFGSRE